MAPSPPRRGCAAGCRALVYAAALAGGDLCFLLATHRLPAAQANLLAYLWPVMIAVMGAAVGLFRLRARQGLGLALGFAGAAILLWDGHIAPSLSGVLLAVLSGALWAAYCVFRLLWKAPTRLSARARLRHRDAAVRAAARAVRADGAAGRHARSSPR